MISTNALEQRKRRGGERRGSQSLEQAAQSSGGATILGDIEKMYRCGTKEHRLVQGLTVLGEQLDSMILEGFSTLNDSMILRSRQQRKKSPWLIHQSFDTQKHTHTQIY